MKIGDFVSHVATPDKIGRIHIIEPKLCSIKWSNGSSSFHYKEYVLLVVNMTESEKMLWILENE